MSEISARLRLSPVPNFSHIRQWLVVRQSTVLPLVAILVLQTVCSLSLQNTAFQDEALYLYAGRAYFNQVMTGQIVQEPYGTYLSGTPFFYPLIAGALDALGGLEAARAFSLVCMLFATVMVFWTAKQLFGGDFALLAAALFAVQGAVIFLGWFATYDAMCVGLLSLAIALAVRTESKRWLLSAAAIGLILFVAVASKYAALLFTVPVLVILAWQTLRSRGFWRAALSGLIAVGTFGMCFGLLLALNSDIHQGLAVTTTNRNVLDATPRDVLIINAFFWISGITAFAFIGLLLVFRLVRGIPVLALIFFGAIFLAPLYHIYKTELVSMYKHMAFSFLFAAPLAGYALGRLAGFGRAGNQRRFWLFAVAVLLLFWNTGFDFAQSFYSQWSNSADLMKVMETQVRPTGRYLAEESEVPRYYLQNTVHFWQWNNLYWFDYTDQAGNQLSGIDAYKAAINDGYWDLVILRYGPSVDVANAITPALKASQNYELLTQIPVSNVYWQGYYWIWRRRAGVTVRSLTQPVETF